MTSSCLLISYLVSVCCHSVVPWNHDLSLLQFHNFKISIPSHLAQLLLTYNSWPPPISVREFFPSSQLFKNNTHHSQALPVPPPSTASSRRVLRIYYQNMSGMRGDMNQLFRISASSDFNVIILTETWLKTEHLNSEIFSPEWEVFRCDRTHSSSTSRSKGVLIAVHTSLPCSLVQQCTERYNLHNSQQVWVELTLDSKSIFICGCYIHHGADISIYDECLSLFNETMPQLSDSIDILIYGDFNLPGIIRVPEEPNSLGFDPSNLISPTPANCGYSIFRGYWI